MVPIFENQFVLLLYGVKKRTIVRQCRVLFKLLNNVFNDLAYSSHLLLVRVDTLNVHKE